MSTFEPVHPAQTADAPESVVVVGLCAARPECEWPPSAELPTMAVEIQIYNKITIETLSYT